MRTSLILASFALVGSLSTGCATTPTWSLRVENATGHDLAKVSAKIDEVVPTDTHGSAHTASQELRVTGGGGSASHLSAGDSATFEASAEGTPQITLQVAWVDGEPAQEFHVAGLRPGANSYTVRLTADRRVEIVDGR